MVGETLNYQTFNFTVLSTDGPRLDQIEIRTIEPETLENLPETINSIEIEDEESPDVPEVSESSE